MTYTAKEIARYIVDWFYDQTKPITNMQLQKLLYFGWIEYYKQTGQELFSDPFEAWKYGPVVPEEYYRYARYGSTPIFFWFTNPEDTPHIDKNTKRILNDLLSKKQDTSAFDLVAESHDAEGAWYRTKKDKGLYSVMSFQLIKELKK